VMEPATHSPHRVVLITGCSAGIGMSLAIDLVNRPAPTQFVVYATMRDLTRRVLIDKWSTKLATEPKSRLLLLQLDVTKDDDFKRVVATIIEKHGRIDIVINNAGLALAGYAETTTVDEIKHAFDVNYLGVVRMLQHVLPHMRKAKSGHIFSSSTTSAARPSSGLGFYGASKAALSALHDSEGPLLAQWNIKMTLIEAGIIQTKTTHMSERALFGTRQGYKDDATKLLNVADGYEHTLKVVHALFQKAVPRENLRVDAFCTLIFELINKGATAPARFQTPGAAVRVARDVWADPDRHRHVDREERAVEYYLTRDLATVLDDSEDESSSD